jgi:hypothetical protein
MVPEGIDLDQDERLNAVLRAEFLQQNEREVEEEYRPSRYEASADGLYRGTDYEGNQIMFNPSTLGIFPFDRFVCRTHLDRRLRDLIFPQDRTLERIREDVISLHGSFVEIARESNGEKRIVAVGSGSVNEFISEYAQYGTVGENVIDYLARKKRSLFSQKPDEIIVLGYSREDRDQEIGRLRLLEKNVGARDYIRRIRQT